MVKGKKQNPLRGCLVVIMLVLVGGVLVWQAGEFNRTTNQAASSAGATLAAAGASATEASPAPLSPTMVPTMGVAMQSNERLISQAEYGEAWPFTVAEGTLRCERGDRVIFIHEGVKYALNGLAISFAEEAGYVDFREAGIWRDNPDGITPKVYVGDIIQLGLSLCEGASSGVQNLVVSTLAPAVEVVQETRPANCDEAVAMGLTAAQAAQWSHLDRDGDGVACYGD